MIEPKPEALATSDLPNTLPHTTKRPYRTPTLEILGRLRNVTWGTNGMGADGALGITTMSDRRAKEDIVEIARHPLGLGVYRFRYRTEFADSYGAGPHVGVMADEVAGRHPDAVSRRSDGHLMVDYGRLFGLARKQ